MDSALEEGEPGDGTMTDDFLFLIYGLINIMDTGVLHGGNLFSSCTYPGIRSMIYA